MNAKIEKLLRFANNPAATPAEWESYRRKAEELRAKENPPEKKKRKSLWSWEVDDDEEMARTRVQARYAVDVSPLEWLEKTDHQEVALSGLGDNKYIPVIRIVDPTAASYRMRVCGPDGWAWLYVNMPS